MIPESMCMSVRPILIILGTLRNSIDVLGDIGGIFEVLNLLMIIPIGYISSKMFSHQINKKIYDYHNCNVKPLGENRMDDYPKEEQNKSRHWKSLYNVEEGGSPLNRQNGSRKDRFSKSLKNSLPNNIKVVSEILKQTSKI